MATFAVAPAQNLAAKPAQSATSNSPAQSTPTQAPAKPDSANSNSQQKQVVDIPIPQDQPALLNQSAAPAEADTFLPDFISAPLPQIRGIVPALRGLRPAESQQELRALLDKVGAKTVDISQKTPDLIAHELVVESSPQTILSHENFSYLILAKRGRDNVMLVEYRVDLSTGAKLQTEILKPDPPETQDSSPLTKELADASKQVSSRNMPMLGQGFAGMWTKFYPANRPESAFRYLGRQKIGGHKAYVLAFSQIPSHVPVPAQFQYAGKVAPIFFQGVAWVDESSDRILRMYTTLEKTVGQLRDFAVDAQFAEMPVSGYESALWLPREVLVTANVSGMTTKDKHTYSQYRAFRVHTKMILNP
jgi:hypothetical protein